mmetsp:Transcript_11667/g.15855  ORF Transcript_11667/g.15855 Transcript_11667/m.15855 type:complete len:173 (+) Transcript_11667:128-646(+)
MTFKVRQISSPALFRASLESNRVVKVSSFTFNAVSKHRAPRIFLLAQNSSRTRVVEVDAKYLLVPTGDGSCDHLPQKYDRPNAIELSGAEVTVGRDAPAEIIVPFPTVSGSHCQLAMVDDEFYIMDLSSTNGTFLNGRQLTPAKPEKIPLGSELIFGDEFLARFELREVDEE